MWERWPGKRRTRARGIDAGVAMAALIYWICCRLAERLWAEVVREFGKIGAVMVRAGGRRAAAAVGAGDRGSVRPLSNSSLTSVLFFCHSLICFSCTSHPVAFLR